MKQQILRLLRNAGLMRNADQAGLLVELARTRQSRASFRRDNPAFPLPPVALAYDAFGSLDPEGYRSLGLQHARLLAALIQKHAVSAQRICDWGCGPMRILRHMPDLFPAGTHFVGLDYNPDTIQWCKTSFPQIEFRKNELRPPLPLEPHSVDALYCISVFTHLSKEMHFAYAEELRRVLRPGGLLIATTHGDRYRDRMLPDELREYETEGLVCRGQIEEGKRMYVSFQSPAFMREQVLRDFDVVEHDDTSGAESFHQDLWIAKCKP